MLDVVIRGGSVVDGTGMAARQADVAINSDRVAVIGRVDAEARSTIDATGKIVAPGFIDVHTHYDAQVFWDGALTPSPLHGITTAIAGNCGFTIAPLTENPADGEYLMRMLARVEGIPIESLQTGVPWDWQSTADYFERIERHVGINVGFMVGHSAIRRAAMGADAAARDSAGDELDAMCALLRDGLEVGALGFSSSWSRAHNDADGHMVPSRCASRDELIALARVVMDYEGTSLEMNPNSGKLQPWAIELLSDLSCAAARPINWNLLVVTAGAMEECERQLQGGDYAARQGGRVVALTLPGGSGGTRVSLHSGVLFDAMPTWEEVMLLPHEEKLAAFRDPETRERLREGARRPDNPAAYLAHWERLTIVDVAAPENEEYLGRTIGEIAEADARDPWDVMCAIALADKLRTGFAMVSAPDSKEDWQARVQVWRDGRAVIGGSDAGAHLDMMSTAGYTTRLLGGVRDYGLMGVEEAVHLLTQVPAEFYGLRDRGVLREGWKADVVVFDEANVCCQPVELRYDLPGGTARLVADPMGVDQVIVNGVPIVSDGALTDARPGTLIRAGQDTTTPPMA